MRRLLLCLALAALFLATSCSPATSPSGGTDPIGNAELDGEFNADSGHFTLTIIDDRIRYGAWRHGIWAMNHDWTYRVTDSRIALRDSATGALRGHLAVTLSDEWKDLALPLKFECISADCGSAGALLFVRWGKIDESGNWLGG